MNAIYGNAWLVGMLSALTHFAFAQTTGDTTTAAEPRSVVNFRLNASVTNNGFSFIPSFSLGKPATIFTFNLNNGKRFSFEPELRFSLEGKPAGPPVRSFIFIWRYRLVQAPKFQLTAGTHLPALAFRTVAVERNGTPLNVIQSQRFLPVEVQPIWAVSERVSVGMFYLYAYGLDKDATRHTHFLSLRGNVSAIRLTKSCFVRFNPQVFYLKMDSRDGYYAGASLALAKRNFPLSVSSIVNKPIRTAIAGRNFDWNVSVVYTLDQQFVRR